MCASYKFEPINVIKFCGHFVSKEPPCASGTYSPCFHVLGVTPDKITESTLMWNLLSSSNDPDLVDGANLWAQTSVNAENLAIHYSSEDQEIKDLATCLPYRRITVFLLTFLVKPIHLRDLSRLVVTPDKDNSVRVSRFLSVK